MNEHEHWSTRHLSDDEVRLGYQRIMSRVAGDSFDELVRELQSRLAEARSLGWLDEGELDGRRSGRA